LRALKDIDIRRSIDSRKLHYKKSWGDYIDVIVFPIALLFGFVLCPILILLFEINFENPNEKFVGLTICPLLIFLGTYGSFRKISELHLRTIKTKLNKEEGIECIITFAKNEDYTIRRKSNYCLVLDQFKEDTKYAKTAVILITDKALYYTMIQDDFRLNSPTFISHILFKINLKRWLKNNVGNTSLAHEPE
jgi:hypothetical protein